MKISKEELKQYSGKNRYSFYQKSDGNVTKLCEDMWLESREKAEAKLAELRQQSTVPEQVFYELNCPFFVIQDDGSYEMIESHFSKSHVSQAESEPEQRPNRIPGIIAEIKSKIEDVCKEAAKPLSAEEAEDIGYLSQDFISMLDNYDADSRCTHTRAEFWNLDLHLIRDLEHNLRMLRDFGHGIPDDICDMVDSSLPNGHNLSEHELTERRAKAWKDSINGCLHHIWKYMFHTDMLSEKDVEAKEWLKKNGEKHPIYPGTEDDINYAVESKIAESEWSEVWKWWTENGQKCWD